ncbi:4'-phosphopantetheinyl transferase [Streptomyces sp. NPDC058872]|uniref:4'-phosphopantetheinyl transferase family protein n=1 Tax=Streptomyces sp. NPDC058872 TaxID=3346661 RepID=UPI00367A14AF
MTTTAPTTARRPPTRTATPPPAIAAAPPGTPLIARLLPADVASAEAFDDTAPAPLFPAEAALMEGRRARRRQQFATARACARRCLAELGHPPQPLLPGRGGAPRWPSGVTGSITHCDGYRAAAAARTPTTLTLGIDAEPAEPLPIGVLGLTTSPAERAHLAELADAHPETPWPTLLFSAKESIYKAWYPITGMWLGFRDATVHLTPEGTFTAVLHPPSPTPTDPRFQGRWLREGPLLLTATVRRG